MKHSLRKVVVSLASLAAATMLTSALPSANAAALPQDPGITARAHVQGIGWQGIHRNGAVAGTTGQGKRSEALFVRLTHK